MFIVLRKREICLRFVSNTQYLRRFESIFCGKSQTLRVSDQIDYTYLPSLLQKIEVQWKPLIDNYWKNVFTKRSTAKTTRYLLAMIPYSSGSLHLGHIRVYTTSDVMFRISHLRGFPSIHPMGFDSFGLPAENAAKERSIEPQIWTQSNINQMREQLDRMGFKFNWRQSTSDPEFYKWTQWLFIQLYKSGLVYKGMGCVNWDPIDRTVLAEEQVDSEGKSWRSGAKVEKRYHKQWFIKTNSLMNELFKGTDIENSGHWRQILSMQRNWLQRPNGYVFYLNLANSGDIFQVFTKHPELFCNEKTFIAISAKHWLALKDNICDHVINPFTRLPMDIRVVDNIAIPESTQSTLWVDSLSEDFMDKSLREKVLKLSQDLNIGGYFTSSTYRDWLISRQRYWGTPIPIVYCKSCGIQPVPEEQLPVRLPQLTSFESPLSTCDEISNPIKNFAPKEWLFTECPECGSSDAIRETETCDTFIDSSWYYLRYASELLDNKPFDPQSVVPTFCYIGGKEHAALHLLYARFMTHFLHQKGLVWFREPFQRLLMQSIVKGKTYKIDGKYVTEEEAKEHKNVVIEYEKMSKSKGNGVNPQELVEKYGSDATRWTLIADGTTDKERLWDTEETEFGPTLVFLHKVLLTVEEYRIIRSGATHISSHKVSTITCPQTLDGFREKLFRARNECLDDMLFNIEYNYNMKNSTTACHILIKAMRSVFRTTVVNTREYERCLAALLIVISPFVPHFAAECWNGFTAFAVGCEDYDITKPIFEQKWPQIDDKSFEHKILFTYTDKKGKHIVSHRRFVSRSELNDWTESDVKRVVEEEVKEEEIEKIEIIKDVVVIVRLKRCPDIDVKEESIN